METLLVSGAFSATIAGAVAVFTVWWRGRTDISLGAAERISQDAENLRKGLMEEIDRQDRHIAAQDAEIARLRTRVEELEKENWRLLREGRLRGNGS